MSFGKTNAKTSDLANTGGIQASIFCVWDDEKPMTLVFSIWVEKTDLQSYHSRVSDAAAFVHWDLLCLELLTFIFICVTFLCGLYGIIIDVNMLTHNLMVNLN